MVVGVASVISHSSDLISAWLQLGLNVTLYAGREVLGIQDTPALEYLKKLAAPTSLNSVLARGVYQNGTFEYMVGDFASSTIPPKHPYLTFTFSGLEQVRARVLVEIPQGFNSSFSFYRNLCTSKHFDLPPPVIEAFPALELSPWLRSKRNPSIPKSVVVARSEQSGIIAITEFRDSFEWRIEISNAFEYLVTQNITSLLLDLRDSSGDYFCGAYAIMDYLFPHLPRKRFPLNFSQTSLFQELVLNGPPSILYSHTQTNNRQLNYHECRYKFLNNFKTPEPGSIAIKILSNQICTQACSRLVNGLNELNMVPTYNLGLPHQMASHSPGGLPYDLNTLLDDLKHLNLREIPSAPSPLLTKANLYFPLGQAYTFKNTVPTPLDYVWRPAHLCIDYTQPINNSPTAIYRHILGEDQEFEFKAL